MTRASGCVSYKPPDQDEDKEVMNSNERVSVGAHIASLPEKLMKHLDYELEARRVFEEASHKYEVVVEVTSLHCVQCLVN